MKKSQSLPYKLNHHEIPSLRKSKSNDELSENQFYFEEFFEGDGPLGIMFSHDEENKIYIKKINKNTVADETFGLQIGMILMSINNESISGKSFKKVMRIIGKYWNEKQLIHLSFKKKINHIIYSALESINYTQYYDDFIELGAKELIDFNFVEYSDLVAMNIPHEKIKHFIKLKPTILSN